MDALKEQGNIDDDGPDNVNSVILMSPQKGETDKTIATLYECEAITGIAGHVQ